MSKETSVFLWCGIVLGEGCFYNLVYLLFCSSMPKDVLWLVNCRLIILVGSNQPRPQFALHRTQNLQIQDNLVLAMDNPEYCEWHCQKMVKPQIKEHLTRGGLVYECRMQRKQGLGVTLAAHNPRPRLSQSSSPTRTDKECPGRDNV